MATEGREAPEEQEKIVSCSSGLGPAIASSRPSGQILTCVFFSLRTPCPPWLTFLCFLGHSSEPIRAATDSAFATRSQERSIPPQPRVDARAARGAGQIAGGGARRRRRKTDRSAPPARQTARCASGSNCCSIAIRRFSNSRAWPRLAPNTRSARRRPRASASSRASSATSAATTPRSAAAPSILTRSANRCGLSTFASRTGCLTSR